MALSDVDEAGGLQRPFLINYLINIIAFIKQEDRQTFINDNKR